MRMQGELRAGEDRMGRNKGGGGGRWLLLVVACLAVGAGGWNYARNSAAEERVFRPYKSYSPVDLAALISAYDADIKASQERYALASRNRATAATRVSLNGRVREFERVQRSGRATRELGADLAEKQVTMKLLREEIARRERGENAFNLLLRRVFVYRADS